MSYKLSNRPFLLIETLHRPAGNTNTSVRGWMNDVSKVNSFESIKIVDRVKNKHLQSSAVIIDVLTANELLSDGLDVSPAMVKNRFDGDAAAIATHYLNKYREQIQEALNVWVRRNATAAGQLAA